MNPIELTDENVVGYLKGMLGQLPFEKAELLNVEQIHDQTYVNWIFRAELIASGEKQVVYLRQSRGFVKKKPDIRLPAERIAFEVKILSLLHNIIPGVIPEVLYFDAPHNIAFLSDIKKDALLLVHELTQGKPHPETGKYFGHIIATIHGQTKDIKHEQVRGSKEENDAAIAFNRGMRTEVAEKRYPEIVRPFLEESNKYNSYLVLGDLASKNIFIDGDKVRFLDLERSFIGDSAFDLAFLFCHYLIEVPAENLSESLLFIENFLNSYKTTLSGYISSEEIALLEKRLIKYVGITVLYRLNGFYLAVNAGANKEIWEAKAEELLKSANTSLLKVIL